MVPARRETLLLNAALDHEARLSHEIDLLRRDMFGLMIRAAEFCRRYPLLPGVGAAVGVASGLKE